MLGMVGRKRVYKISGGRPAQSTAISMATVPAAKNSPITAIVHGKGTHTQPDKYNRTVKQKYLCSQTFHTADVITSYSAKHLHYLDDSEVKYSVLRHQTSEYKNCCHIYGL